jgi:hypothetical protein
VVKKERYEIHFVIIAKFTVTDKAMEKNPSLQIQGRPTTKLKMNPLSSAF